jgi:hypothetical protein
VRVLPSEVAAAIDGLFGPRSHDIDDGRVGPQFQADVSTIISLLDQVPNELIDFGIVHYTELMKCRAARRAGWSRRRNPPSWQLLTADHDPPYTPSLPFCNTPPNSTERPHNGIRPDCKKQ